MYTNMLSDTVMILLLHDMVVFEGKLKAVQDNDIANDYYDDNVELWEMFKTHCI